MTLVLHSFGPAFGAPDSSPFCIKLETFLKLAGIAYERASCDLAEAPKGKGPYVRLDGELIGDSELIIRRLEALHGIDLDAGLEARERAAAHGLAVMLEERTYHALVFNRWHEPANWPVIRDAYFGDLPDAVREGIRVDSLETLRRQGIGRHAREEIYALGAADLDAVAGWLGERPFMGGDRPRRLDCTAYAFLAAALAEGFESPLRERVCGHPNLVAYHARLTEHLFPGLARAA